MTVGPDAAGRLPVAAARIRTSADAFADRLTAAEPATGERWDRGQVLSHVAEMLPYWLDQARHVVAGGGDCIAFGRVKSTPARLHRIEDGRYADPAALLDRMDAAVADVTSWLRSTTADQLALVGAHESRGRMTVAEIVEEFVVRHLEEHADQLAG